MENYGKILLIAMPAFLILVLLEKWYGWKKGFDTVRNLDMISSLSSGITNVTKDVLGLSIAILSYDWMVKHFAVTHIQSSVWLYVIAFFVLDFAGYWVHRFNHEINFMWNNHIIHHSSEEFNLACALRQSISTIVKLFAVFLLPAALLGVPHPVIAIVAPLHLFAQFSRQELPPFPIIFGEAILNGDDRILFRPLGIECHEISSAACEATRFAEDIGAVLIQLRGSNVQC